MNTKFLVPIDIPQEHNQNSAVPAAVSRSQHECKASGANIRCGSAQNLVPLCSREHGQNCGEQQRTHQQDGYAHPSRMIVKLAICVFHQVVEQVDGHNEECDYHEGNE